MIHVLSDQLYGRLCTIHLQCRHVHVIDEEDKLLAKWWTKHTLTSGTLRQQLNVQHNVNTTCTYIQIDIYTHTTNTCAYTYTQNCIYIHRQIHVHKNRKLHARTCVNRHRQAWRQAYRQTDGWTDRRTDRWTHTYTYKHIVHRIVCNWHMYSIYSIYTSCLV